VNHALLESQRAEAEVLPEPRRGLVRVQCRICGERLAWVFDHGDRDVLEMRQTRRGHEVIILNRPETVGFDITFRCSTCATELTVPATTLERTARSARDRNRVQVVRLPRQSR
jgi:hypothetical protein